MNHPSHKIFSGECMNLLGTTCSSNPMEKVISLFQNFERNGKAGHQSKTKLM